MLYAYPQFQNYPLLDECLVRILLAKLGLSDRMGETLVQWFNPIKVYFLLMQNPVGSDVSPG